jgi:hypothetical protein
MEEAAGGITFWVLAKVLRLTPKFNFESHTLRKINANAKNAPDEAFPNPLIAFSSSSQRFVYLAGTQDEALANPSSSVCCDVRRGN